MRRVPRSNPFLAVSGRWAARGRPRQAPAIITSPPPPSGSRDKFGREAGLKFGFNFPLEGETRAIRGRGVGGGRFGIKPASQRRPGDSAAALKRKADSNKGPDAAKRQKYFLVPVVDPNAPRSTRPKAHAQGAAAGAATAGGSASAQQRPTKGAKGPAAKPSGPGSTSAAAGAGKRKYKLKLVPKLKGGGPAAAGPGGPSSAGAGVGASAGAGPSDDPLSPSKKSRLGDSRETCGRLFSGVRQRPNGKWVAMIDLPRPPKPKDGVEPVVRLPVKETVGAYDTAEEAAEAWCALRRSVRCPAHRPARPQAFAARRRIRLGNCAVMSLFWA